MFDIYLLDTILYSDYLDQVYKRKYVFYYMCGYELFDAVSNYLTISIWYNL